MTFRTDDGDKDKFNHSLHHYPTKKFDQSFHYYPQKIIHPEQKYYETKKLECNSLYLNGASSYINCGNNISFDITAGLTIGIIINISSLTGGTESLIGKTPNAYEILLLSNGTVSFYCGGTSGVNAAPGGSIEFNRDNSIVGVYDGVDTKIYVNGIYISKATTPLAPQSLPNEKIYIGSRSGSSRFFKDNIKYAFIYNKVLTIAEILNLHKNLPISNNNLILDLPIQSNHSGDTTVKDLSDNGNDGTLTNCKWNCEYIREKHKVI